MNTRLLTILLSAAALIPLAACSGVDIKAEYPTAIGQSNPTTKPPGSVFGEGGLDLFGNKPKPEDTTPGIGVNSFLWRASLDTISFMPVSSADPFGGTILTDWQSPPKTPGERLKVNIYILDRMLRSDGLRVSVFRQVRDETGAWVDAEVTEGTARKLEDAILTRARQMRQAQATGTR